MFFRKAKRIAELEKEVERLSLENDYLKNMPLNYEVAQFEVETYKAVVNFPEEVPAEFRIVCAKKKLAEELYSLMKIDHDYSLIEGKEYTRASIRVVKEL